MISRVPARPSEPLWVSVPKVSCGPTCMSVPDELSGPTTARVPTSVSEGRCYGECRIEGAISLIQ